MKPPPPPGGRRASSALHALLSQETYERCFEILDDMAHDPRLAGVKALVLLP